jgi:ribosomal protein L11 methyltransferase
MSWWLVEVALLGAAPDAVARSLVAMTGHAVEERDTMVLGYAADEGAALAAGATLSDEFGREISVVTRPVPETDWTTAWREGLGVRTVGRLRLGPSWLLEPGPDTVVIDPETAFGSGEHGSTRGALFLLERHLRPGGRVVDLGSGSGILTIAAVKLGARSALGIEVDDEAVPVSDANAAINLVADRTRFLVGDAAILSPLAGPADMVVSNILRNVNQTLLAPIAATLAPEGVAIFAGMEEPEAPLFRPVLEAAGFRIIDETVDQGWWSVAAAAPKAP